MVRSLIHLPDEILHLILCYSSPQSCAAVEQTNSRFQNVTNERLLWRHHCQSHYKFWDGRHDMPQKLARPVNSTDWKALFVFKYQVDQSVSRLLDSILGSQTGRIEKCRRVINMGYDTKDTLLRYSMVDSGEDYLARSIAIPEWAKLKRGEPVSLDRALACFDLFISESGTGDLDEIRDSLDKILDRFVASHPDLYLFTPREKALAIASWLALNDLTGINPGREYHSLEHNFLGLALKAPGHNSLPLVSAAIYCFVAQGVGLNARPCGFPFHVHVIITPELGSDINGNALGGMEPGEPFYLDPFRGARETAVSNLRSQLTFLGMSNVEDQIATLGEASTSGVVLRCGKNILNSIRVEPQNPTSRAASIDVVSAKYAALWSVMLLSGDSRPMDLRHQLPWLMELFATDFPSDIFLVEQYIAPLFHGLFEHEHILESLHVMRAADEIPKQIRRRTGGNANIQYRVGQVFRHRRYHYEAIITGWDSECGAGEQWMRRMGIDRLEAGRHQSFYHVLVADRSVRYVAEENIGIILPRFTELPKSLTAIAGKHFKRWDETERVFVSNMKDEYPDD
ncbi:hypothetical protein N7489_002893 [Penicillium chrysogenum]|uniref:F-box domain-containing protein n=1 Tax=Penicillium chrysogenum TaxID=5076 RepID=A0ABQ8WMX6_PENCH|nr:uncharacterized protein N7489_002893 [Penicillium chrysogenum]KAJ5252483.1 hypothetical protein N7489_002893 [Penicillium chrysogenum]KAJ5271389.1 hypothetical protein N7505_007147 [Penicillium chrysogenum]